MNPLVSLIIPVYNVRNYVTKCLKSVRRQTYQNLEVILVNDGSTDDSPAILSEYATKYSNFHCYTIENRGLGGARNYGMEKATGDYILFLDSDDYLAPECVEKLVAAALDTGSDLVVANCYDVREDGSVVAAYRNQYRNATTNLDQEPGILFNRVSAWAKLYKRELLDGLEYVSRVWYEDMRMTPKIYLRAKKITYIEDSLFYYVQRSGSIMNSGNCLRNLEIIDAFQDFLSYYQKEGKYEQFRNELEFMVIEHVAVAAISRAACTKDPARGEVLLKLQSYLGTFDNLYTNPYLKGQEKNRKIILWCNRHRCYWLTSFMMSVKQRLKSSVKGINHE